MALTDMSQNYRFSLLYGKNLFLELVKKIEVTGSAPFVLEIKNSSMSRSKVKNEGVLTDKKSGLIFQGNAFYNEHIETSYKGKR